MRLVALIRSWSRPRVFLAALVLSILAVGGTAGGIVDDATDSSHLGAAVFATVTAALYSILRRRS